MRPVRMRALAALLMVWTSLACSPSAGVERVDALKSEPAASAATNEVALGFGRVVDEQGAPVANATVELVHDDRVLGRAVSGADGKFEVRGLSVNVDSISPPLLYARSRDGRAVHRSALTPNFERPSRLERSLGPFDGDWNDVVLKPAHVLEVRVVGAPGSVKVEAHLLQRGAWGWQGWLPVAANQRTGDGLVLLEGLPPGRVQVTATDGTHGACEYFTLPGAGPVELNLEPLRTCVVRVVDKETGAPVVGAELTLQLIASESGEPPSTTNDDLELDPFRIISDSGQEDAVEARAGEHAVSTDEAGVARVGGLLPGEYYSCKVDAQGYRRRPWPLEMRSGYFEISPSEDAKRLLVRPQHLKTMRWHIPAEDGPLPPDGAQIEVRQRAWVGRPSHGPALVGRMERRTLVVHGVLDEDFMHFVATSRDGARAHLSYDAGASAGHESRLTASSFVPPGSPDPALREPRSVQVTLRDAHGRPAKGVRISLFTYLAPATEEFDWSSTPLDAPRSSFELPPLAPYGANQFPRLISDRDLADLDSADHTEVTDASGRAHFEGIFSEQVEALASHPDFPLCVVKLGDADLSFGDTSLEAVWSPPFRAIATVSVDGRVGLPTTYLCLPSPALSEAALGRLMFELPRPPQGESVRVTLTSESTVTASALLTPNSDGSTTELRLDLKSNLKLALTLPWQASVDLVAERLDPELRQWISSNVIRATIAGTGENLQLEYSFSELAAGRWRMRDKQSGAVSTEVELGPDHRTGVVTLLGQ